jgi:hypothetical protein
MKPSGNGGRAFGLYLRHWRHSRRLILVVPLTSAFAHYVLSMRQFASDSGFMPPGRIAIAHGREAYNPSISVSTAKLNTDLPPPAAEPNPWLAGPILVLGRLADILRGILGSRVAVGPVFHSCSYRPDSGHCCRDSTRHLETHRLGSCRRCSTPCCSCGERI